MHIVMRLLLGVNRGRYVLLADQTYSGQEAKYLGQVSEILQPDKGLARAWKDAEALANRVQEFARSNCTLPSGISRRAVSLVAQLPDTAVTAQP